MWFGSLAPLCMKQVDINSRHAGIVAEASAVGVTAAPPCYCKNRPLESLLALEML